MTAEKAYFLFTEYQKKQDPEAEVIPFAELSEVDLAAYEMFSEAVNEEIGEKVMIAYLKCINTLETAERAERAFSEYMFLNESERNTHRYTMGVIHHLVTTLKGAA